MYEGRQYVTEVKDLPEKTHFAVLYNESRTISDSYSNTPGASYTEQVLQYLAFDTEAALNKWILGETQSPYGKKTYKVIRVNPVEVKIHTSVTVND